VLSAALCAMGCRVTPSYEARASEAPTVPDNAQEAPYVQRTPARDPALDTPNDPVWRAHWATTDLVGRERAPWEGAIAEFLDVRPGLTIADLGAGGGYHAVRLARAVGPSGRVIATDIDPRMTRRIAWEAHRRGLSNLTVIRNGTHDLGISDLRLDRVLFSDTPVLADCTYHRQALIVRQLAAAVRPGGRVVYMSSTPESGQGPSECTVPSRANVIAALSAHFELLGERSFQDPTQRWGCFVLHFRRRASAPSGA